MDQRQTSLGDRPCPHPSKLNGQRCGGDAPNLAHPQRVWSGILAPWHTEEAERGDKSMLGTFQGSALRIEVEAVETVLRDSLTCPAQFQRWLWPQRFSAGLPEQLYPGLRFTGWIGPIAIQHSVEIVEAHCLRLILSQGIDGFHEWYWGEGWVQSRLEGISLLPLNLGQTLSLMRLRQFLRLQQTLNRSNPASPPAPNNGHR